LLSSPLSTKRECTFLVLNRVPFHIPYIPPDSFILGLTDSDSPAVSLSSIGAYSKDTQDAKIQVRIAALQCCVTLFKLQHNSLSDDKILAQQLLPHMFDVLTSASLAPSSRLTDILVALIDLFSPSPPSLIPSLRQLFGSLLDLSLSLIGNKNLEEEMRTTAIEFFVSWVESLNGSDDEGVEIWNDNQVSKCVKTIFEGMAELKEEDDWEEGDEGDEDDSSVPFACESAIDRFVSFTPLSAMGMTIFLQKVISIDWNTSGCNFTSYNILSSLTVSGLEVNSRRVISYGSYR
jgi:hypothetical protein